MKIPQNFSSFSNRLGSGFVIGLLLVAAAVAVYWPVGGHGFVSYDDPHYVSENPYVREGLNLQGLAWSFTFNKYDGHWHPLTWISYMLGSRLYGMGPGGHHLTSLALHAANAALLFGVLGMMTGSRWRSAFVAALFAVHPLNVESVAWASERKNVLSTFFWLLTLWGYVRYVRRPRAGRYLTVLLIYALGLLSKPMLVTLPVILLLLDYWPLGRMGAAGRVWPRVREKLPFLCLAAASCAVTFIAMSRGGAVGSLGAYPAGVRLANALVSCAAYIGKMIWPCNLAFFYPHPGAVPGWKAAGAGLLLGLGSLAVVVAAKRRPYLLTGWFWYLVSLAPVIGLVQIGRQGLADRYAYVPLLGLFMIFAWAAGEIAVRWCFRPAVVCTLAAAAVLALGITARMQVGYWSNSVALYERALDVTEGNYVAHVNLGLLLAGQGREREAIGHFRAALSADPHNAEAYQNLGYVLIRLGRHEEAIRCFREAVRLKPAFCRVRVNLGLALAGQGMLKEAIGQYREVLRLEPDNAEACYSLGLALAEQGRPREAMARYREVLRLAPEHLQARNNLGLSLAEAGRAREAERELREALRRDPGFAEAHNNLGLALVRLGRLEAATRCFREAVRLKPDYAAARRNLQRALELIGNQ